MRCAIYPCEWQCFEFPCPNHRYGVEVIQDARLRFHPLPLLRQRDNACNLKEISKVQISNMPMKRVENLKNYISVSRHHGSRPYRTR